MTVRVSDPLREPFGPRMDIKASPGWKRVQVCEHGYYACVDENGLASDGEPTSCDMRPCEYCGALCPGSTWTVDEAADTIARSLRDHRNLIAKTELQVRLFKRWEASRGR